MKAVMPKRHHVGDIYRHPQHHITFVCRTRAACLSLNSNSMITSSWDFWSHSFYSKFCIPCQYLQYRPHFKTHFPYKLKFLLFDPFHLLLTSKLCRCAGTKWTSSVRQHQAAQNKKRRESRIKSSIIKSRNRSLSSLRFEQIAQPNVWINNHVTKIKAFTVGG